MFSVQQNITFETTSGLQVSIMKKKNRYFLCAKSETEQTTLSRYTERLQSNRGI